MLVKANKTSVAVLTVPECTAGTVFGMYDLFCSTVRDRELLSTGMPGESPFAPRIVSRDTAGFRTANGAWLQPDSSLDHETAPGIICVPELLVPPEEDIGGRYGPECDWLQAAYEAGAVVASTCSGTLLMAEAGLLDDREATTHWAYVAALKARYPAIKVRGDRVLISAGQGGRLITSGGGTSWQDLALFLIARFHGVEEAMWLAKLYLVDWHQNGQLPYSSLARSRQYKDRTIGHCQEWIAEHYATSRPVGAMTELSGLTERTFKRRFAKATGMTPIEYVHTLRLEEAKQMLETTQDGVDSIAGSVGYEDTAFFRRLFRRRVGLTPRQYRTRFASIRSALKAAVDA